MTKVPGSPGPLARWQDYVDFFVSELTEWRRRRAFLDHLASTAKSPAGRSIVSLFVAAGGAKHVASMLLEAPRGCDEQWPGCQSTMAFLLKFEDSAECLPPPARRPWDQTDGVAVGALAEQQHAQHRPTASLRQSRSQFSLRSRWEACASRCGSAAP